MLWEVWRAAEESGRRRSCIVSLKGAPEACVGGSRAEWFAFWVCLGPSWSRKLIHLHKYIRYVVGGGGEGGAFG